MLKSDFYLYECRLPHWRLHGATYFVTWRLADGQPDLTPEERTLVAAALRHFDRERYTLVAFVIMNDHIHTLVTRSRTIGFKISCIRGSCSPRTP